MKLPNFAKFFFLDNTIIVVFLLLIYGATSIAANGHTDNEDPEGLAIHNQFKNAIEKFVAQFAHQEPDSSGSNSSSQRHLYLTYANVAHILMEIQKKVANKVYKAQGNTLELEIV